LSITRIIEPFANIKTAHITRREGKMKDVIQMELPNEVEYVYCKKCGREHEADYGFDNVLEPCPFCEELKDE
jgi:hypothetical protein